MTSFDPLKHGSVFGWHGSQLGNWHVIMRTGLKNLSLSSYVRGTAHGPGIYFGYDHSTSAGCVVACHATLVVPSVAPSGGFLFPFCFLSTVVPFFLSRPLARLSPRRSRHAAASSLALTHASRALLSAFRYTDQGSNMWPETDYGRGKLGAHQTMCLVEVVARPEEFTKVSPYLVVPQEEFIQERYFTVFDNSRGGSTPNVDMGTLHRKCTRLMEERRSAQLGDSLAGTVFT